MAIILFVFAGLVLLGGVAMRHHGKMMGHEGMMGREGCCPQMSGMKGEMGEMKENHHKWFGHKHDMDNDDDENVQTTPVEQKAGKEKK